MQSGAPPAALPCGITGWSQLHRPRSARRRRALDAEYLAHWSLRLDAQILVHTLLGRRAP